MSTNGSHDHDHEHDHDDDFEDDGYVGALVVFAAGSEERMEAVIVLDLEAEDDDQYFVPDEDADPEAEFPGFGSMLHCLDQVAEAVDRAGRAAPVVQEGDDWDSDIVLFDGNWAVLRTGDATWEVMGADPDEADDVEEPSLASFAQSDTPVGAVRAFLEEFEADVLAAFGEAFEEFDQEFAEGEQP